MLKAKMLILSIVLLASTVCYAQEFTVNESRPAITKYKIASLDINFIDRNANATVQALDADANVVSSQGVYFTGTAYTAFINALGVDATALVTAIKTKTGK